MISFENIPEELKIGAGSMPVAEVLTRDDFKRIVNKFSGVIFSSEKDGRYFIKMQKKYFKYFNIK